MKLTYQDIGQLNDATPKAIQSAIVVPAKEALRQLRQAIGGNLTLRDNAYAAIVTLGAGSQSMTSGVEYTLQNPLKTKPIGFTPIKATDSTGATAYAIGSSRLNLSRTDGLLGVTINLDYGGPYLESTPNTNQSLTTGTRTAIVWDGTMLRDSSGTISVTSSTHIAVSSPGLYLFTGQVVFSLTTPGYRGAWTAKNGTNDQTRGNSFVPANQTDITGLDFAAIWPMLTTDYVEVYATQTSGANLTVRGAPSTNFLCNVQVTRVGLYPGAAPQLVVTGILWGG